MGILTKLFGKSNRNGQGGFQPIFDLREYQHDGARRYAPDNDYVTHSNVSGDTGLVPLWSMQGAIPAYDVSTYNLALIGQHQLAASGVPQPLKVRPVTALQGLPDDALSFILDNNF